MAYIRRYKHDIFISYAHADDSSDPQGVQWVSDFQVYIKRAVKQHLAGYEPDIFFDALDLHPNHQIKVVLSNARESAIFLPIISPSYVERPWPNDELEAFSQVVSDPDRIFAVELLPPHAAYPAPLSELKRKEFWWRDEKQGSAPRRCTPKYESQRYSDNLDDVAYLIARRLREMQTAGEADHMTAAPPPEKTVLLADVTDDLRRIRRQVREYLEQYQFNVLPKRDYPDSAPEFAAAFDADLAQANVFVQLLSEVRSVLDMKDSGGSGAARSRSQYQYEAAKRNSKTILQWRGPEVDPSTVTHYDQPLLVGPQVLAMGLQEFMKEIRKILERPVQEQKLPTGDFVFINADHSDKEISDSLLKLFEDNQDWMVMEPLFEGSADQILEDLEANLKDCAALLLVYGHSGPPWVRAQLRRYNKLEKSRLYPPKLKTILLGPPAPKSERDIGSAGGFTKIDCQNGVTMDIVSRIVSELRR
jgi:hypothetical protein